MGVNRAAQAHATAMLSDCTLSHWGADGLRPQMRYTLTGGRQHVSEIILGLGYCLKPSDGHAQLRDIRTRLTGDMQALMRDSDQRSTVLDRAHRRVNVGLAWDEYNLRVVQLFEGDYVSFVRPPGFSGGVLAMSAAVHNGVALSPDRGIDVAVHHDPPPRALSRGQLSGTSCVDPGRLVALLRPPAPPGRPYAEDRFEVSYRECPDPYDAPGPAPAPVSAEEAVRALEMARRAAESSHDTTFTGPRITADEWSLSQQGFSIRADLRQVLDTHGPGVYTVSVTAALREGRATIMSYSIFHLVEPPAAYPSADR